MQANQANVTFDTHKAVKVLKGSGFDEKQAEGVVETINQAVNETVATKSYLEVMASKMATKEKLGTLAAKMATKDDIKDMATKDDLKALATKAEFEVLKKTVEGIQENMVTKAEFEVLKKTVEGIQDNMATKTELAKLETRMMRMMMLQTIVLVGLLIPIIAKLLL